MGNNSERSKSLLSNRDGKFDEEVMNQLIISLTQSNKIIVQVTEALSAITATLNIHLNIGQSTIINTAAVFISLERATIASLSTKLIKQVGNAQISMPSIFDLNLTENTSVLLRVS
jgi:exosortase/archaeosortase